MADDQSKRPVEQNSAANATRECADQAHDDCAYRRRPHPERARPYPGAERADAGRRHAVSPTER